MGGSKMIKGIIKWSQDESADYDEYLSLVLMALQTHSFWWFQKSQMKAALKENHKIAMKNYEKLVKGK